MHLDQAACISFVQISPLQSSSLKAIWNSGNGENELAARAANHVSIECLVSVLKVISTVMAQDG